MSARIGVRRLAVASAALAGAALVAVASGGTQVVASAATAIEYGLIAALISVATIA